MYIVWFYYFFLGFLMLLRLFHAISGKIPLQTEAPPHYIVFLSVKGTVSREFRPLMGQCENTRSTHTYRRTPMRVNLTEVDSKGVHLQEINLTHLFSSTLGRATHTQKVTHNCSTLIKLLLTIVCTLFSILSIITIIYDLHFLFYLIDHIYSL